MLKILSDHSFQPSAQEFLKLTAKGNLIPVYKEILGDLETPVSAYLKIAKDADYSFLLESVEGEAKVARFSFLAKDPELVFRSKGRDVTMIQKKGGADSTAQVKVVDTPLTYIREIMAQFSFVPLPGLPRFCGGLVGYIGYEAVRFFENIPHSTTDDLDLPDILLVLAKDILIFDHLNHTIKIVSCVSIDPKASKRKKLNAYSKARKRIERTIDQLHVPLPESRKRFIRPRMGRVTSNFSENQFKKIIDRAKKHIFAGDIIQVVLSQRFQLKYRNEPFNAYRALRSVNPSPYMYYLHFKEIDIIGSSPELLVRCEDGVVETRPIAGTRPRGKDEKEDKALSRELLADPKEKAEHIMLVDLGRNDLGRVCEQGTVQLSEFMSIEKYSHVMHIVSNVRGKLRKDKDIFDVLQSAFPAGTVSGAPKIRAMEIIDELEKSDRGPYAGCIGYFSFSGNLDSCITIRTIVLNRKVAYIQAGAGIVADSVPKNEYLETMNKARAQVMALELAQTIQ